MNAEPGGPLTEAEILEAAAIAGLLAVKRDWRNNETRASNYLLRLIGEVRRHRFARRVGRKARAENVAAAVELNAARESKP